MRDFEDWEDHHAFHQSGDYKGLVAYCEADFRRYPSDLFAAERLSEAYILDKRFHKAIQFCGQMHRRFPSIESFQHNLLDALFALGKSEHDFDWLERPTIVRLDADVGDKCCEFLKGKRKPRSVDELHYTVWLGDYVVFTVTELLEYLRADARFFIVEDEPDYADVKLAPKRRSRKK